jgi:EpsI family protein
MRRSTIIPAVSALLLTLQAILTYGLPSREIIPSAPPLASIPSRISDWIQLRENDIDPKVQEMLGPDDILDRAYSQDSNTAQIFVAYYKTQRRSRNAHDPRVCLPGAGWVAEESRVVSIPGQGAFEANYYRVSKGGNRSVVIYWYQTHDNTYGGDQSLKTGRLLSNLLHHRTDVAFVRVVVPVQSADPQKESARALALAGALKPELNRFFPPGRDESNINRMY